MPARTAAVDAAGANRVVATAAVAGLLLSLPLWVSAKRIYPTAPISDAMAQSPLWLDGVLFAVLLGALATSAFGRLPKWSAVVAMGSLGLLVAYDQSRLQPWVYGYAALLAVLAARSPKGLAAARLIVVATYFWSGLQKLNVTFLNRTWFDLTASLPDRWKPLIQGMAVIVPIAECAIAVALLVVRVRRTAVVAVIVMHTCILAILVTSGENVVVWPWNIAMALLTVVLFWRSDAPAREILVGDRSASHALIVALFVVMPTLSLFGWWDAYLSSALYSGNTPQAMIYVSPDVVSHLPSIVRANTWQASLPMYIDLNRWSFDELRVPAYPSPRVFRRVARDVCRDAARFGPMRLRILDRPDSRTGQRHSELYRCGADLVIEE